MSGCWELASGQAQALNPAASNNHTWLPWVPQSPKVDEEKDRSYPLGCHGYVNVYTVLSRVLVQDMCQVSVGTTE